MDTSLESESDQRDGGVPEPAPSRRRGHRARQVLATTALTVGMAAGGFGIAHAATSSTSSGSSSSGSSSAAGATAPARPPSGSSNPLSSTQPGPGETLLTGDAAAKATAAAKAAVPGGTIIRVETDANQGAKYEAHMKKSNGSYVTVLMDSNFKVTSIVPFGPSAGGQHGTPPNGAQPPSGTQPPTATPSA